MDCPLFVSNESAWQDVLAIETRVWKCLRAKHQWVTAIRVESGGIANHGTFENSGTVCVFGRIARAALDPRMSDKKVTELFSTEVANDLKSLFAHPITVHARITFRDRTDYAVIVPSVQLKPELVRDTTISIEAVWREIVNGFAPDTRGGFEIDPNTISINGETRTAATMPRVLEQQNGFVFVSRSQIEVERRRLERTSTAQCSEEIAILTTTAISRCRKPGHQSTEIPAGDPFELSSAGMTDAAANGAPLHQLILAVIKR